MAEAATCLLLAWASASDLRTRTIPNACSVGGAVSMAAVSIFADADPVVLAWSVGLVAVFFGAAVACRPRSLGAGDAKLAVLLAAAMGPLSVPALLLGLALALSWCLAVSAVSAGGPLRQMAVPLAPFLAVGAAATLGLAG